MSARVSDAQFKAASEVRFRLGDQFGVEERRDQVGDDVEFEILGLRVWGLGFGVLGFGFRVEVCTSDLTSTNSSTANLLPRGGVRV